VNRIRRLSTEATGKPWANDEAKRWRIEVADGWGRDRWVRLEQATQRSEANLRSFLSRQPASSRHR
jgi:hypothetical protein